MQSENDLLVNPVLKKLEFCMLGKKGALKIDSLRVTIEKEKGPDLSSNNFFFKKSWRPFDRFLVQKRPTESEKSYLILLGVSSN